MKSRVLPFFTLLAAVAACVFFFRSFRESPGVGNGGADSQRTDGATAAHPADSSGKNPATGNPTAAGKKPAVNWDLFKVMDGGSAMPAATPEDIARFLAKHGETAANLIAAFESTQDRRWLDRALELFPDSPVVLMKAIDSIPATPPPKDGEAYEVNKARLDLIERFKAADPKNPVPWIFAAQEFFKAKQAAEGIAEIRAALDCPAFYTYSNERMDAAQRLYESLGLGPLEASALAMFGLALPHMSAAMQSSRGLMEWEKSAAESGDTAAVDEALRLAYSLGRTFATPESSRMLIGQLVGIAMEKRALEALPSDAQRDWLAVAPAQRLAEIEKQKQAVKDVTAASEWVLQSRDEQLLSEWLRRVRSDGETAALNWVRAQKK